MWLAPLAKWANRANSISTSGCPIGIGVQLYNSRALPTLSYVSQFAALPELALPRERALLGRILHLPGNAFGASDFFALEAWGSYKIVSVLAQSAAILMRAALVTLCSWRPMYQILKDNAETHIDLHQVVFGRSFTPRFWDSRSIAELLFDASLGFPSSKRLAGPGRAALNIFEFEKGHNPKFPHGVQTKMYNAFVSNLYADTIPMLIKKRLRVIAPLACISDPFDCGALREQVSALPPFIVFVIIRTWANGWTTSHRMHEPRLLPCLFGCPGQQDCLQHYLQCERAWRALKTALRTLSLPVPP
eukprot:5441033-Karenia_brevis.AAC.1